ncbi:hypothetical protein BGZ94_004946 [Podila epigama]|nr:hypothetical protein BGZ94_004946 [Podila epigama]
MTITMKIELDDSYLVLPYPNPSTSSEDDDSDIMPETSMIHTSPSRTMSLASSTFPPSSTVSVRSLDFEQDPYPTVSPPVNAVITATNSHNASPNSNASPSFNTPPPPPNTTPLTGQVILTSTNKPSKIASLSLTLNGSTHVAFLGTGKRAHYSRQHIKSETKHLIEPSQSPSQYTLVSKDLAVSYPFTVFVPNNLPVSVSTPQGGTIYRLTANLTLAKSSSLISFLSSPSTFTTAITVQLPHREQESEEPETEREREEHREQEGTTIESLLNPPTIQHTWPGILETQVSIPYADLPSDSRLDLRLRVRVLRENVAIKSFQAALCERAIFSVQKAGAPLDSKKYTLGVHERIISAQRCDAGWVVLFAVPSALRSHNAAYTSRSCNPATLSAFSQHHPLDENDETILDSEFGEVYIEIQHFIRYSIFATGSVDARGKTLQTPVERVVGESKVILRGLPAGPECDRTGLPSYLYSFSTSRVSTEEARDYELEATNLNLLQDDTTGSGNGPIYGDYGQDDAFMAIMGFHGSRTPPSYEESLGRPSLDASIRSLQLQESLPSRLEGLITYDEAMTGRGHTICLTR